MELDWRTRKILDNLWGPSGSLFVHVIVVFLLFTLVVSKKPPVTREIEVVIKPIEEFKELDDIEEELDQLEDIPTVVDVVTPPSVSVDQQPPQVEAVAAAGPETDVADIMNNVMEATSPLIFRGIYAARGAGGRGKALAAHSGGMGQRTEYAVLKGLKWLKDHQDPAGSWGPRYQVAMTGLSLLAFFAHGETTGSEEFGEAIRKGLKYLLKTQQGGTFVAGGPWHLATQVRAYEHAIGTYAISEAYGVTSIPSLKSAMEDAVQVIIDGQHEGGSWDYGYLRGPEAHTDVSLGGWHVQALEAAQLAGAENMGIKTAIENGIRGMKRMSAHKGTLGLFAYSTRVQNESPNNVMTGVAVLCMQLTGHALDAEARAGIEALKKLGFQWQKGDVPQQDIRGVADWPYYAWYYITQARFHQGGASWMAWNKQFAPTLCSMQNKDGSWCPPPASTELTYGPVYCTALSCLMLEVYYRFLPTYKPIDVDRGKASDEESDEEEIVIKFG